MSRLTAFLILFVLLASPLGAAAQPTPQEAIPELGEEAIQVGQEVGEGLPGIFLQIWKEQVAPILSWMWQRLGQPLIVWIADLIQFEERKKTAKQEFEQEKQELKESAKEEAQEAGRSLWERFKALLN